MMNRVNKIVFATVNNGPMYVAVGQDIPLNITGDRHVILYSTNGQTGVQLK